MLSVALIALMYASRELQDIFTDFFQIPLLECL